MKRSLSVLAAVIVAILSVVSCAKEDDTEIRQRLDKLEGSTINTISQQISAIEGSIGQLQSVDTAIRSTLDELKLADENITAQMFDSIAKMDCMLRNYTDSCRQADLDWISTTYSTIAMQDTIYTMISAILYNVTEMQQELEDSLDIRTGRLMQTITQSVASVHSWVNESLSGYYTIAEVDARLSALERKLSIADSISADGLKQVLAALAQTETDLTKAYKEAISDAIETNNGIINKTIAESISAVNTRLDKEVAEINLKIAALEGRIDALEETVRELSKKLDITFSDNDVSCSAGDIVEIDYKIINGSASASVYSLGESDWKATATALTDSTGTITVTVPSPFTDGTVLVFLNDQNKSVIKALNFIKGSMTVSTDVVEVGASGGNVSVNIDTDLQYTVSVQDDVLWLHNATITTRSAMRQECVTLTADASPLAFPRNAVVRILNASGEVLAQYTVRQAGNESNHEYVDLGLSVKWATCNVGATRPEEFGDYFAWGAIEPWYVAGYAQSSYEDIIWKTGKNGYLEENTPYFKRRSASSIYQLTKYVGSIKSDLKYPTATDADAILTVLDLDDDAAHMNWGANWRMPTKEELAELLNPDNCIWSWYNSGNSEYNGVAGYEVESIKPGYLGNRIFLPAAGHRGGWDLDVMGPSGYYWSSSLNTSQPKNVYDFWFDPIHIDMYSDIRTLGQSVRPVSPVPATSISLSKQSVEIMESGTETLIATVNCENGATGRTATWTSSNTSVAYVDQNGLVTAVSAGISTIIATSGNFSATCDVIVKPFEPAYVDLGLSVKWATFNVGATKPEDYGDYFSWGETITRTDYSNGNYKHYNNESHKLIKYDTDGRTVLEPEDDAAHMNWGGSWRMPTQAEMIELCDNCTFTWYNTGNTEFNGKAGFKVASKIPGYERYYIFLPAAGQNNYSSVINAGSFGYYWSSSLFTSDTSYAYESFFGSSGAGPSTIDYRYSGHSVRPVHP